MAVIRHLPEDFKVDEIPLYTPHGTGPFTLLHVEKTLRNTEELARELADQLDLEPRSVGYAGRKDRRAVTRQWFSVPDLPLEEARDLNLQGVEILDAIRHRHSLRAGDLEGNRFQIKLREVETNPEELQKRQALILNQGMPNRFGKQRYGRDGTNAEMGHRILNGERLTVPRRREGLFLSALQSSLFDEVLKRRNPDVSILLNGDLALDHDTGGLRPILRAADHASAADRLEISPTGPILGHKMRAPKGDALRLEQQAARDLGLPWIYELPKLRRHHLSGGRRPLRIPVPQLALEFPNPNEVLVRVTLPPGSYATVLLEELFTEPIEEHGMMSPHDSHG